MAWRLPTALHCRLPPPAASAHTTWALHAMLRPSCVSQSPSSRMSLTKQPQLPHSAHQDCSMVVASASPPPFPWSSVRWLPPPLLWSFFHWLPPPPKTHPPTHPHNPHKALEKSCKVIDEDGLLALAAASASLAPTQQQAAAPAPPSQPTPAAAAAAGGPGPAAGSSQQRQQQQQPAAGVCGGKSVAVPVMSAAAFHGGSGGRPAGAAAGSSRGPAAAAPGAAAGPSSRPAAGAGPVEGEFEHQQQFLLLEGDCKTGQKDADVVAA